MGPGPTRPILYERLVGMSTIAGAIVWPLGLLAMADAAAGALAGGTEAIAGVASVGFPAAVATALFAATAVIFERHATTVITLPDLVGDLCVAIGALVFLVASAVGVDGLLGPALVVLLVGSLLFGLRGLDGKRRPSMASASVGSGAGGLIGAVLGLGVLGPGGADTVAGIALLSVGLLSLGWAWLGLHLALARPFPRAGLTGGG